MSDFYKVTFDVGGVPANDYQIQFDINGVSFSSVLSVGTTTGYNSFSPLKTAVVEVNDVGEGDVINFRVRGVHPNLPPSPWSNVRGYYKITLPIVETLDATNIQTFSSEINGDISGITGITVEFYFRYREVGTQQWTETTTGSLTVDTLISEPISSLTQFTEYEYQLLAWNTVDPTLVVQGDIMTFKTPAVQPTVQTNPVNTDEIYSVEYSLTLGNVTGLNYTAVYDFQWREVGETQWSSYIPTEVTQDGTYTQGIYLPIEKDWEVRTVAWNTLDKSGTIVYGDTLTFNTEVPHPDVTTNPIVDELSYSERVVSLTLADIVGYRATYGFEFREQGDTNWIDLGTFGQTWDNGTFTTEYEFDYDKTYDIRGYAWNNLAPQDSKEFGNIIQFNTLVDRPSIVTSIRIESTTGEPYAGIEVGNVVPGTFPNTMSYGWEYRQVGTQQWITPYLKETEVNVAFDEERLPISVQDDYEVRAFGYNNLAPTTSIIYGDTLSFNTNVTTINLSQRDPVQTDYYTLNLRNTIGFFTSSYAEIGYDFEYRKSGSVEWTGSVEESTTVTGDFDIDVNLSDWFIQYESRARGWNTNDKQGTLTLTPSKFITPTIPIPQITVTGDVANTNTEMSIVPTISNVEGLGYIASYGVRYRQQGTTQWIDYGVTGNTTSDGTGNVTTVSGLDPDVIYEIQGYVWNNIQPSKTTTLSPIGEYITAAIPITRNILRWYDVSDYDDIDGSDVPFVPNRLGYRYSTDPMSLYRRNWYSDWTTQVSYETYDSGCDCFVQYNYTKTNHPAELVLGGKKGNNIIEMRQATYNQDGNMTDGSWFNQATNIKQLTNVSDGIVSEGSIPGAGYTHYYVGWIPPGAGLNEVVTIFPLTSGQSTNCERISGNKIRVFSSNGSAVIDYSGNGEWGLIRASNRPVRLDLIVPDRGINESAVANSVSSDDFTNIGINYRLGGGPDLGGGRTSVMRFGEKIVYRGQPTEQEDISIKNYLLEKWF